MFCHVVRGPVLRRCSARLSDGWHVSSRHAALRACSSGRENHWTHRFLPSKTGASFASIGMLGGSVGAVVGIGGGNVMVPLMTMSSTLSQHQITATSLVAVVSTGTASAASYFAAGAVDAPTAAVIMSSALLTAQLGARFAAKVTPAKLRLYLALFVLASSPTVLLKSMLLQNRTRVDSESCPSEGETASMTPSVAAVVGAAGALAGFASGLLGIGGGVVLTPALAMLTDLPQVTVLGTSLTAMIIPSLSGAWVHYQAGTIVFSAAWPLALGAGLGAAIAGRCATELPEQELRYIFSGVMGCIGIYMLRGALRGLK